MQAYEIVNAPFTILEAYNEAEAVILEQCATVNQRALYHNLPSLIHKRIFLGAIVKHILFKVPV